MNQRDVEQRALEALDADGMIDYLCSLIAVRSVSGEETDAQRHVAVEMARCGLEVDLWELDFDALKCHPSYSAEIERTHGLGVVGVLGEASGGRRLIVNGHVDVVPVGDESNWRMPPWEGTVQDGCVYGRGSLDMKGALCAALYAAKAIRDAGAHLSGQLIVQSVVGEEDGGVGTLAAIERGYRADGAIVVEPTELMVAPAQAGALNFRVTVPGRSAHGCVRDEGVSAIEKFAPLYESLMELERTRNAAIQNPLFDDYRTPYAICVGTVRAGTWASSVAESLTFEGRFGVAVGEDTAVARVDLEDAIARAADADPWLREHRPVVEWWGAQFEPAGIPPEHALVGAVSDAFRSATGEDARVRGMTYGSDMRLLVNAADVPTVLFGPGDIRNAHRPDEFVPIRDLIALARTLIIAALRFCKH